MNWANIIDEIIVGCESDTTVHMPSHEVTIFQRKIANYSSFIDVHHIKDVQIL